jgi:hypothetical protein
MVVRDVVSDLRESLVPSRNVPARDKNDHTTEGKVLHTLFVDYGHIYMCLNSGIRWRTFIQVVNNIE